MPVLNYANRGRALEDLIILANERYRQRKEAVIHKVPTEWIPIRGQTRKIVSAKVEKKAAVDFLGHIGPQNPVPIAFDAKEVTIGSKWPLKNLEQHQYDYLRDCYITGAVSFILLGFWECRNFFILPFTELETRWAAWKQKTGSASIKAGENGLIETRFIDYLYCLRGGK